MSDKNIEIIKAIQSTGQVPASSGTQTTQLITEGKQPCKQTETRLTEILNFTKDGTSKE